MSVYGCVYVMIVFLVSLQYIGLEILYKMDNMILFMQFLALSLLSMTLRFEQKDFYRFLYGFRWAVGNRNIQFLTNSLIFKGNPLYLENAPNNAPFLLTVDNNVLRNCLPLFFLIAISGVLYVFGYIFLKRQLPWRFRKNF